MDPYLEAHWRDVHASMVNNARNAIQRQLGGNLRARIEERLVVEENQERMRVILPDVDIIEKKVGGPGVRPDGGGVAVMEPVVLIAEQEEIRETFIQIIDVTSGGRVITIIEFISPTNKQAGDGRRKYQAKQTEVVEADINMVEIDLTRAGERESILPLHRLPLELRATYMTFVRRGFAKRRIEAYPIPLRNRLPAIRIPLRESDPDVILDIQRLIDQAYEEGRYDDIDYSQPCVPPLQGEEAAWAGELLKSR